MASSALPETTRKRPNRSAAERRAQHQRAQLRACNLLLRQQQAFKHRGTRLPSALAAGVVHLCDTIEPSAASDSKTEAASLELQSGMYVRLKGLKDRSDLNGFIGRLSSFDNAKERWVVGLGGLEGEKLFKAANLEGLANTEAENAKDSTGAPVTSSSTATSHQRDGALELSINTIVTRLDEHILYTGQSFGFMAQQFQYVSYQLDSLHQRIGILTAFRSTPDSQHHSLQELVDNDTFRRIQNLKKENSNTTVLNPPSVSIEQQISQDIAASSVDDANQIRFGQNQLLKLRVVDIRVILSVLGLQQSGLKDDLVARLVSFRGDRAQLHGLKLQNLKDILPRLGIKTSGNKQDQIERFLQFLEFQSS